MNRRAALVLIAASTALGCVPSAFTQTDDLYRPHRGSHNPKVFIDRLPSREYKSVGLIEVGGGGNLRYIISRAMEEGRFVGCELLVPENLHRVSMGLPGTRMLLAYGYGDTFQPRFTSPPPQQTPAPSYVPVGPGPPPQRFICGIYVGEDAEKDAK
jgi:hypothetical protein